MVAFDFETQGDFNGSAAGLTPDLLSFAWEDDSGICGVVYDFDTFPRSHWPGLMEFLEGCAGLVAHNMNFELTVLKNMGFQIRRLEGKLHDTMIALHCENTEQPIGLKANSHRIGMQMTEWEEASSGTRRQYIEYNRNDSIATLKLWKVMSASMTELDLWPVYNMERSVAWLVMDMMEVGIQVDLKAYNALQKSFRQKVEYLIGTLSVQAGRPINVRSVKELRDLIFGVFGLVPGPTFLTSKGVPSTDQAALSALLRRADLQIEHREFLETLMKFREYDKLLTAYFGDKFNNFIDADGRIRAVPQPLKTRTGRFSYKNPNLQNIPARGEGAELRRCFTATPGNKLICIDMSQIEYRLLAHFSNDPSLIQAYHTGDDLHQATAELLGIPRSTAKNINFGVIYGQGPYALSEALKIGLPSAREYLDAYFARFPGIGQVKQAVSNFALWKGYIRTMSGRIRSLEAYRHYNDGSLERKAFNTLIQGSAADLMKLGMVKAAKAFSGTDVKIVVQVHDELVLDCPPDQVKDAMVEIQDILENVHKFAVPIVAQPYASTTWLEAKGD